MCWSDIIYQQWLLACIKNERVQLLKYTFSIFAILKKNDKMFFVSF